MTAAALGFWFAVAMLAYAYAGFPLLVAGVGLAKRRPVRRESCRPRVSFIVVAYNEAAAIAPRLRNIFELTYPRECLEVIVASDGSSDETESIVRQYADQGVTLLSLPRRGKIPALNDAAAQATGEILVFSDANIHCLPDSLDSLVRNFADPAVGGVAGHCSYLVGSGSESTGHGEQLYWSYDTWLKSLESGTGSVVSAHGGYYAIRRALFRPVTDAGVTDDFAISTAVIEQGYRLVFDPGARAFEYTTSEAKRELGRRVRLMTRGLRAVWLRRRLLNPLRYGFYAIALFSHKILRRLAPLWLIWIAASSLLLAANDGLFFKAVAVAQVAFYVLALAGWALRRRRLGRLKPFSIPFYYCMANAAAAAALVHFARGKRITLWQPQRSA